MRGEAVFFRAGKAAYLNSIVSGTMVGIGGSATVKELGLYDMLASHNEVHWHWATGLDLHMTTRWIRRRERFSENIDHMVEAPHCTEKDRRLTLPIVQEELCAAIALIRGLRQPIFRLILILSYFFPLEVQFAEDILRVLGSSFNGLS